MIGKWHPNMFNTYPKHSLESMPKIKIPDETFEYIDKLQNGNYIMDQVVLQFYKLRAQNKLERSS